MTLFRAPNAPTPPTFSEGLRRANAGLPDGYAIAFRPRRGQPRPYRVLDHGRDVGGGGSLVVAVFAALQAANGRPNA